MSTPYMLTAGIARRALVSLSWFWAVAFVIGRLHALHEAYISISQRLQDERYLLERCQDPEFYSNIRQHTGICSEVQANARSSVLLKALNEVAQGTHLCGARECGELIRMAVARITWQAGLLLLLAAMIFPNLLFTLWRALGWRRHVWMERGMIVRHSRTGIPRPKHAEASKEWLRSAPFYPGMEDDDATFEDDARAAYEDEGAVCGDLRRRHAPPKGGGQDGVRLV